MSIQIEGTPDFLTGQLASLAKLAAAGEWDDMERMCGGGGGSSAADFISTTVKLERPEEPPLQQSELRRIREMLKGK